MAPTDDTPTTTTLLPLEQRVFAAALRRGTFQLRSGATSSHYFDKFVVACDPALLRPVAAELARLVRTTVPDVELIVAPELGAVPFAAATSLELGVPVAIARRAAKGYGGGDGTLEGPARRAGARAVLVEDVVTSGGAALDAIATARGAGVDVVATVCVLDRGAGGADALASAAAPLTALFAADAVERALARDDVEAATT